MNIRRATKASKDRVAVGRLAIRLTTDWKSADGPGTKQSRSNAGDVQRRKPVLSQSASARKALRETKMGSHRTARPGPDTLVRERVAEKPSESRTRVLMSIPVTSSDRIDDQTLMRRIHAIARWKTGAPETTKCSRAMMTEMKNGGIFLGGGCDTCSCAVIAATVPVTSGADPIRDAAGTPPTFSKSDGSDTLHVMSSASSSRYSMIRDG